jgi:hypothetical protein
MSEKKLKYDLKWPADLDDAQIEREMIRNGGYYKKKDGSVHGLGLMQHFKNYWALLWPEDSQTWWTDLILENIIKNTFTSLVGPASAWKSGTVARLALMDWSCWPDCTSVIMSSTDMEGLRSRIYGETTMMWKRASERFEWFPGHPVDSKCVITYTNVEEEGARDIRNSILGVACKTSSGVFVGMGKYCFSPHQRIETVSGDVPIGEIKVGDVVKCATGYSKVTNTFSRISKDLISIRFSDGSSIDCTPDHPFFTSTGWVKAVDISPEHELISADEAMSILQDRDAKLSREAEVLFQGLRNDLLFQALPTMFEGVCSEGFKRDFLFTLLWGEVEDATTGNCRANDFWKRFGEGWEEYQQGYFSKPEREIKAEIVGEKSFYGEEDKLAVSNAVPDGTGGCFAEGVSGVGVGIYDSNRIEREVGDAGILQAGHILAGTKVGCGSGWKNSRLSGADKEGQGENKVFGTKRVVSVKVYKPGDKIPSGKCEGGYRVHSIEVAGHPTYSVGGCLVHNSGRKNRRVWCLGDEFQFMQLSILQGQDNLISNDDGSGIMGGKYPDDHPDPVERGKSRRFYRCVFIGNTNPSVRDNPLDVVSEPENGWGSIPDATVESGKTQVWKCKQHPKHPVQCYCINLDGLDSPNTPYPIDRPRWSQLSGPHKIRKYTVGSESYWSNGRGVFKFGLDAFKIITKELCEQHHAFDDVAWEGETTKIGMLDAAYGGSGADRCPLGWLQFGKCVDGKVRLKFEEWWNVPIVIRKDVSPEDQIAFYTKQKMEALGVPPENFFFDGRGTLAMSLAKIWSPNVNALEFGGTPTDRPAGPDLFTEDKITKLKRLKTAKEAFRKFVTELWMSAQYAIASDQTRGIAMEIVLDAQPREWRKVAGDKIEIETKEELKERTGISPDLADMWVTGVEGARRRGFIITKLAAEQKSTPSSKSILQRLAKQHESLLSGKQLQGV